MRKFLSIISALLLTIPMLSHSITIDWLEDKTLYIGEDSIVVPYFDEAQYIDGSQLPYFVYTEPINASDAEYFEYSAHMSNMISSALEGNFDQSYIQTNFNISTSLSCSRGEYTLMVYILPIKYDASYERLESFDLEIEKKPIFKLKSATSWFASNSVLAQGDWYKIGLNKTGIYKLTHKQIKDMGLDPNNLSMFMAQPGQLSFKIQDYVDDLKEIPIYEGSDYFLFYASSQDVWDYDENNQRFYHKQHPFWNENYYYLSDNVGQKKRITNALANDGSVLKTYTSYIDYDVIEPQLYNIDHSGDDWFSNKITNGHSFTHTFEFDNLLLEPAEMQMRIAAQSITASHFMKTSIDDVQMSTVSLSKASGSSTGYAAFAITKTYDFTPQSNTIKAEMAFSSADVLAKGFVDFFSVNVTCDLRLNNDFLCFRNKPTQQGLVKYELKNSTSSTRVWNISNPYQIKNMPSQLNNSVLSFNTIDSVRSEFIALNLDGNFEKPNIYGKIENQNLHGIDVPDMVIITVRDFIEEAEHLADIHRQDGLDVVVIDQYAIFNEFSGGKADITAIRWFMKSLYDRDPDKFKYLLLLGDADVNNRMYEGNPLRLMCYQSDESLNKTEYYVSDDYFGLLDDIEGDRIESSDRVDIGIGRIPVNSVADIKTVVKKIDKYLHDSKQTTWKNKICIVADDQDKNVHVNDADKLAEKIRREHPAMAVKKVYIDAFTQVKGATGDTYPDAKTLIDQYIEDGVLIWGYSGHGSPTSLASEGLMHINDVNTYENIANLPLWLTATCDFCPYDHNETESSGERVLLNPIGGGIGLFTTTRLVYSSSNYLISNNFYNYILNFDDKGEKLRLGDVVRLTKKATGTGANKRKFALIGDPALQLLYADARWDVKTDSINGIAANLFTDTLQALSQMSVTGYITKSNGNIDEDFNGILYPTVYDKIGKLKTLANDADSREKDFLMWNSILFQGKTEIINGRFTFSFMLPKDLNYTPGNARIEYFACSDIADVNGYYENFHIGGFNDNFEVDTEGPEVVAYLNSDAFTDGDVVNSNPVLIADVFDESGINTSGNSIGHDIIVKLNNDASTITNINNKYVSNVGNYKEGRISYTLKDLEEGEYTLTLKLWDMQNNSTLKTLNFVVRDDTKPDISAVYCYPNPVSIASGKQVRFVAKHDRPEKNLEVKLTIYDSQAKLVYQSNDNSFTQNNEVYFDWTPNAAIFKPGLYFYRIIINDGNTNSIGQSQKLIITH